MAPNDASTANAHQRVGVLSNAHAGRDFEGAVHSFFTARGLHLARNFAVEIGHTFKKKHRFDLGSDDPAVLVECKSYTWTVAGNSPSAKIRALDEALLHFILAPAEYRKLLVMQKAERAVGGESLASYFVRTQGHLIPSDVEIWQFDMVSGLGELIESPSHKLPAPIIPSPSTGNANWRMLKTADFAEAIHQKREEARRRGLNCIEINAGSLHRELGGYPGPKASMPSCCNAMYAAQKPGDEILVQPPKGKGASLTIKFLLSN